MGTQLPLPCITLLTEKPQQKYALKTKNFQCIEELWCVCVCVCIGVRDRELVGG